MYIHEYIYYLQDIANYSQVYLQHFCNSFVTHSLFPLKLIYAPSMKVVFDFFSPCTFFVHLFILISLIYTTNNTIFYARMINILASHTYSPLTFTIYNIQVLK